MLLFFAFVCAGLPLVAIASPAEDKEARDAVCNNVAFSGWCLGGLFDPVCDEDRIDCDEDGNAVNVTIVGLGTLPTEIGLFRNVQNFSLADGFFFNGLPSTVSMWTSLRSFSVPSGPSTSVIIGGGLPPEAGSWGNTLRTFDAFRFIHSGTPLLPTEVGLWSNLERFSLSETAFQGSLPSEIANWDSLQRLQLFSVSTSGSPMPTLGKKNSLEVYELIDTDLTSFDDPLLFHSPPLRSFKIDDGPNLAGTVPATIGNAVQMEEFQLSNLPLFSGTMPVSMGAWDGVTGLVISDSPGITGTLPPVFDNFKQINTLGIFGTGISGSLPPLADEARPAQILIRGAGNTLADCPNTFSGSLPQSWARQFARSSLILGQVAGSCIGGRIPEVDPALHTPPSPTIYRSFDTNRFTDPLPRWVLETFPVAVICQIQDNKFCFKPVPWGQVEISHCQFSRDGQIDQCGVCEGEGATCDDCAGVPGGSTKYDRCGVCGGDGSSCCDCAGVAYGTAEYDSCDVCNGNDESKDCAGVCGGSSREDICGVCDGDGQSCFDCAGVAGGSLVYDRCDVCGGDGSTCVDCGGVVDGPLEYDLCGDCVDIDAPGYTPSCTDCAGVANGTSERDVCGVCGGDGSSCAEDLKRAVVAEQSSRGAIIFLSVLGGIALLSLCVCLMCVLPSGRNAGNRTRPRQMDERRPRPQRQPLRTASSFVGANAGQDQRRRPTGQQTGFVFV